MLPQEFEAPRPYCDLDKLIEQNHVWSLPVELADRECLLEMRNVGSKTESDKQVWIAYFDPRKPDLCEPGAIEIVQRLVYLKSNLIITPSSDKSTDMVEMARSLVSERMGKPVDKLIFKKGKPEDMQEEARQTAFSATYSPITAGEEDRIMVITHEQQERLLDYLRNRHIITVVDDVYSKGATVRAILSLLNQARGPFEELHPAIVVVMRECEKNIKGELEISEIPNLNQNISTR